MAKLQILNRSTMAPSLVLRGQTHCLYKQGTYILTFYVCITNLCQKLCGNTDPSHNIEGVSNWSCAPIDFDRYTTGAERYLF